MPKHDYSKLKVGNPVPKYLLKEASVAQLDNCIVTVTCEGVRLSCNRKKRHSGPHVAWGIEHIIFGIIKK